MCFEHLYFLVEVFLLTEMIELLISLIYYLIAFFVYLHLFLWIWKEVSMGICRSEASLKGKLVLITGGNNGIGFETSVELAKRGAKLIIGCRSTQNVKTRIQKIVPEAEVEVHKLDLSSNKSIHHFADEIKSKYDAIDTLINNAGMVTTEERKSEDGYELTMATNYLGHALLNHLLLDLVKKAGEAGEEYSRIILVASMAGQDKRAADELCHLRPDHKYDIDLGVKTMENFNQYGKSKLAQIMYAKHLAKLLKEEGCNTMVASLHPGFVRTDIFQGIPPGGRAKFIAWLSYAVGKTAFQGAQTTIYLALTTFSDFKNKSGMFFNDCRSKNWHDFRMPKVVGDPEACKALWDKTMALLKI